MKLSATTQRFVLHWGEMGSKWGLNRTVAQIHALLYISEQPLNAEQISTVLSVARSNVSTSLRELQGWGIVRIVHVLGDRRDHFETLEDVWELFRIILDERKKREIDPTIEMVRRCVEEAAGGKTESGYTRKRLEAMLEFLESSASWYHQISRLPQGALIKFIKMGPRIPKLLGLK